MADRKKKTDSCEIWLERKMNKWVLENIKAETLLEAKMTKLKLPYLRYIMSHKIAGSLEKTVCWEKQKTAGKEEAQM